MASSSSQSSRKRGRPTIQLGPPAQPPPAPAVPDQPEQFVREIPYETDEQLPDQLAPAPLPDDLPTVENHTLLQFRRHSDEHTTLQRFLGLRFHRARVIDWALMGRMDAIARLEELITPRWMRLLDVRRPAYHELTLEFHSTFRFDSARLTSMGGVSFALGRWTHIMSIA